MANKSQVRWRMLLGAALSVWLLASAPVALAHQPGFNDTGSPSVAEAYVIEQMSVSKAIFGAIRATGTVDYYRFAVPAGFALSAKLYVPSARQCDDTRPALALIGADVAPAGDAGGLALPDGMLAAVVTAPEWGVWSGHGLAPQLTGPTTQTTLGGGTYYLAVFDPSGATGEYDLVLGGAEAPGGASNAAARIRAWEACPNGAAPPPVELPRVAPPPPPSPPLVRPGIPY